jgi:hypothetical protein
LLVFGFYIIEELVKRRLHEENMAGALHIFTSMIFSAELSCFVLSFVSREVRRVVGEDKFQDLFFYSGTIAESHFASGQAND